MLPLALFARRNFSVANAQTFGMYGGIGILGFFQTIYLQQVAGYPALKAGVTGLVPTIVMFLFSARVGALADRRGPRMFLTAGPLVVACGLLAMLRYGTTVSFLGEVSRRCCVLGRDRADRGAAHRHRPRRRRRERRGIASAVNNAVARVASLVAIAAIGGVVASHYATALDARLPPALPVTASRAVEQAKRQTFAQVDAARIPPAQRAEVLAASDSASESSFHLAVGLGAALLLLAGSAACCCATRTAARTRSPPRTARAASWSARRACSSASRCRSCTCRRDPQPERYPWVVSSRHGEDDEHRARLQR